MFFEPTQSQAQPNDAPLILPEWSAPPSTQIAAVIPIERVIAQSANVVLVMPTIRAYHSGCLLELEIVTRRASLTDDDWWDLTRSMNMVGPAHGSLPDRLLRMGVRYAGGTKATTLEQLRGTLTDESPSGPLLTWWPEGGGSHGGGSIVFVRSGLWLWPLPPAQTFEFAVEWPRGGIELTIVELDGAAIASAADRSAPFWPSGTPGPGQP